MRDLEALRKRARLVLPLVLVAVTLVTGCNRDAETPKPNPPTPGKATGANPAVKSAAARAPVDPRWQRWNGVQAPAKSWRSNVATDVLLLANAPGLDAESVDAAMRPLAAALRTLPGVELVVTRARPGEARAVVRFAATGAKGQAAVDAVLDAWQATPPPGMTDPVAEAIARGARAMAALEMVAMGGRVEATRYADAHPDALQQASKFAMRTHLAGAVRPLLALRVMPVALASNGIALNDVVDAARAWLAKTVAVDPLPALDEARNVLAEIKLKRHWTANGEALPAVPMDRLVDVSVEQGEPTREARNGHLPTTFWIVDAPVTGEANDIDSGLRKVAQESKSVFRPTVQSLGAAYRLILSVPEGKEPESQDDLSKRLQALRTDNESLVAVNAIAGQDGVPEALDVDARAGRRWTVWVSIATADTGSVIFAVREALLAGGWDVHVLSDQGDTALSWVLDAWGAGGALISAEDAGALGPNVGNLAQRALSGREKAGMRQGPQPGLAPLPFRKIDPKQLRATKLTPMAAQRFVAAVGGLQPLGWWHETPVWLGLPAGDGAATVGQMPLEWQGGAGSGPNHAWLANDVLRVADPTPVIERVRVNGRPALWAVPEDFADAPTAVAASFWRLVESTVEMRTGMRVESLDMRERALVAENPSEQPAP